MYKVVQSNAVNAGFGLTPERGSSRISPTLLLEKNSADRAGQLDWTASLDRVDPRVVEWLKKQSLDFDRYVYCMVVPLGADESWEQTTNGDAFRREMLAPENPDWGHKSFEHHANAFRNHRNSNPELGFGDVPFTVFNDQMDRVEGVWRLDRERAQKVGALDAVERIAKNGAAEISMGCFPAGTPVTMEDGSTKPIEYIQVGDLVLTAEGRARRVTALQPRPWVGNLLRVSVLGQVDDIFCTSEHPFLGAKRDAVIHGKRWVENPQPDWIHAECLSEGDYVTLPASYEELTPDYATPSLARLLGYYLAEGHLCRNKKGEYVAVEFTCHKDDALLEEMDALCAEFGTKNEPVYRERTNSQSAVSVSVHDRDLAALCLKHCGTHAKTKQVDASLFSWEPELLLHFFGAYFNGDGCQPKTTSQAGAGYVSTASRQLAEQMVLLLARLGIPTSINYVHHKGGSGFSARDTFEHQIRVGKQHISKIAPYCKADAVDSWPSGVGRKIFGHRMWAKITSVEQCATQFEGVVYNFEVEEDESYLISGVSVHNCRVPYDVCSYCGNKAKNVKQYCSHVRNPGFGAINAVGELMRVFNPWPKFFDLSDVRVPAAPEAHVLMMISPQLAASIQTKTSSGARFIVPSAILGAERYGTTAGGVLMPQHYKASSAAEAVKLSDIVKRAPVLEAQVIRPLQDTEGELTEEKIKSSGVDGLPLPSVLSTLSSLGIVCSPEEICRIIEASTGERHKVPATLEIKQEWDSVTDSHPHISSGFYSPVIADKLRGMVPDRSVFYPHLPERIASYDYGNVHERIEVGAGSRATGRDFRISVEIESDGPMNPIARYIASYLKTLSVKLGKLLAEVSASYPSHQSHCLGAGLLTGPPSTKNPVGVGDHAAAVAFPSSYILSRAGKGSDGEEMQRSIDSLHYPGIEHLFGGLLHD